MEFNMSDKVISEVTQDPFTLVPNFIINDPSWSIETKMTWIFLFSKRHINGWSVRPFYIQKILGYGERAWRRVYKDLTEMGYLKTFKTKNGTIIQFTYDWAYKAIEKESANPGLYLVEDPNVDKPVDNQ
jgi:hypothetical protein